MEAGGSLDDELLGHHGTDVQRTRSCERIRRFCSHGEDGRGNCLSPSGRPVLTAARRP